MIHLDPEEANHLATNIEFFGEAYTQSSETRSSTADMHTSEDAKTRPMERS